jgi:uncharacterized protein YndB with AHSA1/START domain
VNEGELEQRNGRWQVRFVRRLAHPREKVWRAITAPEHLATWFPFDIEGERSAGAPLRFVFREDEGPPFEGEMIVFDPPSVMELSWEGDERVRMELERDGDGTVLTFVNTFDELGKAARDAAGWHARLDLLEYELTGEKPPPESGERWAEVHPAYVERFGPEAATIGPPEGG